MQLIEAVADDRKQKLPTEKYLRENGEVYVRVEILGATITVYTNGFYVYDDGLHATVQRLSSCKKNIVYEFQDGRREEIELHRFADQPFYVRLSLEGEKRLDANSIARASGRVFSYNWDEMESKDLADKFDFAEFLADRDSQNAEIKALRQALQHLTERQLIVLQKYFCENMTHQEIAHELGCSKQAVGKSYRAALKKLKDIIS